MGEIQLVLNEWINPDNRNYSYMLLWPYKETLDPIRCYVDVDIRFKGSDRKYKGSFLTISELQSWFERFKNNGEYLNGTYIPLEREILLEEMTSRAIEQTIEELVKREDFFRYFKRA